MKSMRALLDGRSSLVRYYSSEKEVKQIGDLFKRQTEQTLDLYSDNMTLFLFRRTPPAIDKESPVVTIQIVKF